REVVRPPTVLHADARTRQLGQTDREVQISVGIVGAPTLTAGFGAGPGIDCAKESEAVAEGVGLGIARRIAAEAAEAALESAKLRDGHTCHDDDKCGCPEGLELPASFPAVSPVWA